MTCRGQLWSELTTREVTEEMANVALHALDVLEVGQREAKDALRAVLHSVLFCRALGTVRPRELSLASFPSVSYATCGDALVDAAVEDAIERLCGALRLVGPDLQRGELVVELHESRKRASFLGFGAPKEDSVCFERWTLPVMVHCGALQAVESEAAVRKALLQVFAAANALPHVPKPRAGTEGGVSYTVEFSVSGAGQPGEGLLERIVPSAPPAMFNNV